MRLMSFAKLAIFVCVWRHASWLKGCSQTRLGKPFSVVSAISLSDISRSWSIVLPQAFWPMLWAARIKQ